MNAEITLSSVGDLLMIILSFNFTGQKRVFGEGATGGWLVDQSIFNETNSPFDSCLKNLSGLRHIKLVIPERHVGNNSFNN